MSDTSARAAFPLSSPDTSRAAVSPETSRAAPPDPRAAIIQTDFEPVTTSFGSWARRSPHEPALSQHGRSVSYGELSELARGVARALAARGCLPGDVVALDGRPGFGLIAGILGVFLARGTMLLLDRRLPIERRALMCEEARARHIVRLSEGGSAGEPFAARSWTAVVLVDTATGRVVEPEAEPETAGLPGPTGDDAAYIFFTSGTTGVPKGVLGTHRGLSHFVAWQRTTFGVGPGDRSSQLTGLSFDVVLREVFLPLTSGATLCLPDEPDELGAEQVLPWLAREAITTLHTVPTLAETWLLAPPPGISLGALRRVFFAGEPLPGRLVRRWRESLGTSAQIVNLYGPTETTLAKCCYVVPDEPGDDVQPVGLPLPQTQVLVLADDDRPCGIGEWGEIVIRTPYCTRGYVNAPEENVRRFRPNPLRPEDPQLVYYTGDRGRFRRDGMLEISGRLDDQIKIHGARLEPGEIAVVLARHPDVHQSTVLGRQDAAGRARLVAFVVAKKNTVLTARELKDFLRTKLPEYMVPSSVVLLDQLPLTPNGKVDRRALESLDERPDAGGVGLALPQTAVEVLLAGIWAEVLGVEQVGVDHNFFDLGGSSILMMQVIAKARQHGLEFTQLTMFRYPAVRSLAEYLAGKAASPGYRDVRDRARRQRTASMRPRPAPRRG